MGSARVPARVVLVAMVISLTAFCACRSGAGKGSGGRTMEVIDREGHYASRDGQYELEVRVEADGMVSYVLKSRQAGRELLRERYGSAHQRWFFCWDDAGRLWYYSSDVDFLVYIQDAKGAWTRKEVRPGSEFFDQIPKAVEEKLPGTLKRRWRSP